MNTDQAAECVGDVRKGIRRPLSCFCHFTLHAVSLISLTSLFLVIPLTLSHVPFPYVLSCFTDFTSCSLNIYPLLLTFPDSLSSLHDFLSCFTYFFLFFLSFLVWLFHFLKLASLTSLFLYGLFPLHHSCFAACFVFITLTLQLVSFTSLFLYGLFPLHHSCFTACFLYITLALRLVSFTSLFY